MTSKNGKQSTEKKFHLATKNQKTKQKYDNGLLVK